MSRQRLVGFDVVTSDYKDGQQNIRSICPLVDVPNCHDAEIIEDVSHEMQVFINEGSTTQTLAHDTISLNYFEMDGCSFCGPRTLDVFPELSWLNVNNCAMTIESTEGTDLEISEDLDIDVTLDVTTVTDQWNPMEEWLTTAPEGMGEATTRYTMDGNTIVYNED